MSIYGIPPEVVPGFELIITLNEQQLSFFKDFFERIANNDTGRQPISEFAEKTKLTPEGVEQVVQSAMSLTDIYWDSKDSPEKFSQDFIESYSLKTKNTDTEKLSALKKNIASLVSVMGSKVRTNLKSQEVIRENPNNFIESRIISDIRIVYNDDLELNNKEQLAVIVHNLRIRYNSKSTPRGEIFISLDIGDLNALQKVISRAIEKDTLMRSNSHSLTFINPK